MLPEKPFNFFWIVQWLILTKFLIAFSKTGGTRIREECVRVLEERGKIEPGKAVSTSGG